MSDVERAARARARASGRARAAGLLAGTAADVLLGDPRRFHPVAGFGTVAATAERLAYADSRARGALVTGGLVAVSVAAGAVLGRSSWRLLVTAAATWSVVGGTSLAREASRLAGSLAADDVAAARARLPSLCGRDPAVLDVDGLARATVESVAENTSDAVVAPLVWGAVAGVPGLLGYRAVNTLDAMFGHRSARYARFGWAAARLDDAANYVPARLTAVTTCALAPLVGGDVRTAWRVVRRDGARHPSPNAGRCEAAFAGALGVRLGGTNAYGSRIEHRPHLGDGPVPVVEDISRAVVLARAVSVAATVVAAGVAVGRVRLAARLLVAPR